MTSVADIPAFEDYVTADPGLQDAFDHIQHRRAHPSFSPDRFSDTLRNRRRYLGEGVDKIALQVGNHVLKVVHEKPRRPFEAQIRPLIASLGIKGVEQLVTYSRSQGVIVTELVVGTLPIDMDTEDILHCITPDNAINLRQSLREVVGLPVYYESVGKNVLASKEAGFVLIDPVEDPLGGTNYFGAVVEGIATYKRSNDPRIELALRSNQDIDRIEQGFNQYW